MVTKYSNWFEFQLRDHIGDSTVINKSQFRVAEQQIFVDSTHKTVKTCTQMPELRVHLVVHLIVGFDYLFVFTAESKISAKVNCFW